MKYLKKFSTDLERVEYEGSENYLEPYVSYVEEDNSVHYNKVETRVIATYNVTDASEPILIYGYYDEEGEEEYWIKGADLFTNAEIDGTDVPIEDLDAAKGLYQFSEGEHTAKFTLKDATSIENAFYECVNLTNITIPDSVTSIGVFAFYDCSGLTSVIIPNSVTSIGDDAFSRCSGLTSVIIPNSVTSIGDGAFSGCRGLTSVIIPNSVTSIGKSAYQMCAKLISVTVKSTIPPTLGTTVFGHNADNRKIYVPSESVDAYKSATNWSTYASYIEPIS